MLYFACGIELRVLLCCTVWTGYHKVQPLFSERCTCTPDYPITRHAPIISHLVSHPYVEGDHQDQSPVSSEILPQWVTSSSSAIPQRCIKSPNTSEAVWRPCAGVRARMRTPRVESKSRWDICDDVYPSWYPPATLTRQKEHLQTNVVMWHWPIVTLIEVVKSKPAWGWTRNLVFDPVLNLCLRNMAETRKPTDLNKCVCFWINCKSRTCLLRV